MEVVAMEIEGVHVGVGNFDALGAFNQLQTYKSQITSLFLTNAVLTISDGIAARIGSPTAGRERFMPWRTVSGNEPAAKGTPELETVLRGVFSRSRQGPGPIPVSHCLSRQHARFGSIASI